MAHGCPDYWHVGVPAIPIPAIEQTVWNEEWNGEISANCSQITVIYTVPTGEELYVTGGVIGCDFPMLHSYGLLVDETPIGTFYYDTFSALPFNPSAMLKLDAGEALIFAIQNNDDMAHNYSIFMVGFRVTKVAGAVTPFGLGIAVPGAGVVA